jgi:hypothetical protein
MENRMKSIKKEWIIVIALLVILTSIIIIKPLNDLDEIWNYNFARNVHDGLVPYKDFNMLQMPLFIVIVGAIYLIEVLSVIIQVSYFKMTGGKRIFKMAPIHHHFELCGWSETKVVAVFSIVTAILCLVALMAM